METYSVPIDWQSADIDWDPHVSPEAPVPQKVSVGPGTRLVSVDKRRRGRLLGFKHDRRTRELIFVIRTGGEIRELHEWYFLQVWRVHKCKSL